VVRDSHVQHVLIPLHRERTRDGECASNKGAQNELAYHDDPAELQRAL
jgi:hypothetical protein